ncbi:LCP family protein [Patescibacteria group bacterium]|nr:LCP family protein [Patescibacteria group bacterium]
MKKLLLFIFPIIFIVFLVIYLTPIFSKTPKISYDFGSVLPQKIKSDLGRTNILVFGVDARAKKYVQTGNLTDSIILLSVDFSKKDVKMLSIPRDTWVVGNEFKSKINEIYALQGIDIFKNSVENLLDVKIHYYVKVNFDAFEKIVDSVGGVEFNNTSVFTDIHYPKFGFENETCGIDIKKLEEEKAKKGETLNDYDFPCRYETISFKEGIIQLDGVTALKYARSRHSGNNGEGSDFARARRQQTIILALKDKIIKNQLYLNLDKIKEIYNILSSSIETDIKLTDSYEFFKYIPDINKFSILGKVLSNEKEYENGGILMQGLNSNYGGRYVLIEKTPGVIKSFSNEFIYSTKIDSVTVPKP